MSVDSHSREEKQQQQIVIKKINIEEWQLNRNIKKKMN
jgi:hypothetical protein